MATAIQANGADALLRADRAQISKLEADPNATPAYRQGLEQQLQAIQKQLQDQMSLPDPVQGSQQVPSPAQVPPDDPTVEPLKAAALNDPPPAYTPDAPPAYKLDSPVSNTASEPGKQLGGNLPQALQTLEPDIEKASQVTGEDPTLMAAQVWDESRGQSGATTTNGGTGQSDAGLMQVDAATFKELQQKHPELQGKSLSDNLVNLEAGGFLEQDEKKKFGTDALALRAYNSGEGSVDPSDANRTTTGLGDADYVRKVSAIQQDIESGTSLPA